MSLDMKRRAAHRVDLLCCFSGDSESNPPAVKHARNNNNHCHSRSEALLPGRAPLPSHHQGAPTQPANPAHPTVSTPSLSKKKMGQSPGYSAADPESCHPDRDPAQDPLIECLTPTPACRRWTLSSFARDTYSYYLLKTPVKVLGVAAYIVLLGASVWGATKVKNGLNLTDIVPHQTAEYGFLAAHDRYFGFYNMFAVTQGNFEYPNNQRYLPAPLFYSFISLHFPSFPFIFLHFPSFSLIFLHFP